MSVFTRLGHFDKDVTNWEEDFTMTGSDPAQTHVDFKVYRQIPTLPEKNNVYAMTSFGKRHS